MKKGSFINDSVPGSETRSKPDKPSLKPHQKNNKLTKQILYIYIFILSVALN